MNTPQDLLQQLASIDQMERGTLSIIRETLQGPSANLQRHINGTHHSEYIPAAQVPIVRENVEAHRKFQELVDQYVETISARSREQRISGVKKKRRTPTSGSLKKKKSRP